MATPTEMGVKPPAAKNAKGLTIALLLISVIATFAAVTFYMGRSAEQAKRLWAESELEKVLRLKNALEKEKDELTKSKTELEGKVQELDGKVTSLTDQAKQLSDDLAEEKRASTAARDAAATAKKQAEETRARLEAERREKLVLADDVSKAKQDAKRLQDELGALRQAKEALERRVKEMMSGESAPETIVVTPKPETAGSSAAAPATPQVLPAGSSVLVVNREFNFIVVNLGGKDGLKPGQFLEVLHGGKPIAKVQVERVYDNMTAANILPESSKGAIKEGDQVRRL